MADVTNQHRDYAAFAARAELVTDVVESRVKEQGEKYLPRPNPTDKSLENRERFKQYLERAIFVNYTGNTLRGLIGAAFTKVPELKAEGDLEFVSTNIDGEGLSVFQQSQQVTRGVLSTGRHALFVDYPRDVQARNNAELKRRGVRAKVVSFLGTQVIYWHTTFVDGQAKLDLVVIRSDEIETEGAEFGEKEIPQYIVLRLTGEGYRIERWRKGEVDGKKDVWLKFDEHYPTDGNRQRWNEIPFTFVGSQDNGPSVDMAPLYDMAVINIGHYRNSADYEDSVYMCGQPQFWASGIDKDHYEFLQSAGVMIGSRTLFPVPDGGQMGIAQAQPNTMAKEAMDLKAEQMVALGARIITQGSAVKTATEAQANNESEHSVLSLAVSNVSEAYTRCLAWMQRFMKLSGEAYYAINQDFTRLQATPQLLTAFKSLVDTGLWPESDFWRTMRRIELIDPEKTDEMIKDELEISRRGLSLDDGDV